MSRQARVRSLPQTPPVVLGMVMLAALAAIGGARASDEGYAEMLGYLAQTRIDGQALTGSRGAIAVNMSAGDLNQQANLRAIRFGLAAGCLKHSVPGDFNLVSEADVEALVGEGRFDVKR